MAGSDWFHPRGALARGEWETRVDATLPGWKHAGLRIGGPGIFTIEGDDVERMIVPLDARTVTVDTVSVEQDDARIVLAGRASVFDGPADVAYLGVGTACTITSDGRFAVAESPATAWLPPAVVRAGEVPVEVRGSGSSTRQVRNFGTPGVLAAQKLIVCEVVTRAGNWSSYPPHKHDTDVPGQESRLEEVYWFEASGDDGFGLFAASSMTETVRTGDVALIPNGFHGPAAAAPGYDLYYLNVMAGPDPDRVWLITDDPAHEWVRSTWLEEEIP